MHIIPATNHPNNYPVYIGENIFSKLQELCPENILVVTDSNVAGLYAKEICQLLDIKNKNCITIASGESSKNLKNLEIILSALLDNQHDRDSAIVAIGGGMICDLAGFAAAVYMRGIKSVFIPTTLLAQVDAAYGGKNAVNFSGYKNILGTYHQPDLVLCDIATLKTLPQREYIASLAEVVKYAIVLDKNFFIWLEENTLKIQRRDKAVLQTIIKRCCELKRQIVAKDEHDRGIRMLLNFGHTFGHAIEAATGFNRYLHGEAVALGMLIATRCSVRLEYAQNSLYERIERLLESLTIPSDFSEISISLLIDCLYKDKKVSNKQLTFILPCDLGAARVEKVNCKSFLEDVIAEYVVI